MLTSGLPSNDRLDRITKELIDDTRETAEMRSNNEPRWRSLREALRRSTRSGA
ncbi:hypothetical protein QUB68_05875 [Microcoleus sp. A006_D1]|uniref:hypothetical protein n=1 Tax=Microcoleus sp. A006_D1 TaxID=3055267 RepID=UPI002FD367F9